MIAVRFPCAPNQYPRRQQYSWAQISHFIFKALVEAFPRTEVRFFPQDVKPDLKPGDLVVCNVNDLARDWKRTIIVDNDNLNTDKWLYGKFRKYGMDHPIGAPTDWTNPYIEGALAVFLKTNDVAIRRFNTNDPEVALKKTWLLSACPAVYIVPHPIDKAYFGACYDPDARFDRARMLIYHTGDYKNAKELIELLDELGYTKADFNVTNFIPRTVEVVDRILANYMFFGHVSVAEGFPYLANEFMCDGMMLFGNEEWWDGYGADLMTWSYDPKRKEENANKLRAFFDPANLDMLHELRRKLHRRHMERKDNEWSYFTRLLVDEVRKHI